MVTTNNQHNTTVKLIKDLIKEDYSSSINCLQADHFDFNIFADFISENSLSQWFYATTSNTQIRPFLPDIFLKNLKLSYVKGWERNSKIIQEMAKINNAFIKNNISAIFLKGPIMAKRFYINMDHREILDLDVLINKNDLDIAGKALADMGFKRKSNVFLNKALTVYFTHSFEYENKVDLDLHWSLAKYASYDLDFKLLWPKRISLKVDDSTYNTLPDEYELIAQIFSVFKGVRFNTLRFKSFLDLYLIMRKFYNQVNWDEFFDKRKQEGIFKICLNVLDLFMHTLNIDDEFPGLQQYIAKNESFILSKTKNNTKDFLTDSRFSYKKILWAFKLYELNPIISLLWWGCSLPFKLSVYKT